MKKQEKRYDVIRQYYDSFGPTRAKYLGSYLGTPREAIINAIKDNYSRKTYGLFIAGGEKYYVDMRDEPIYIKKVQGYWEGMMDRLLEQKRSAHK